MRPPRGRIVARRRGFVDLFPAFVALTATFACRLRF
jgi:hypothetical protein